MKVLPKVKITYIVSQIDKALAFEWVATYLDKNKFNLNFILLNPTDKTYLHSYLKEHNVSHFYVQCRTKWDYPIALLKVMFYLITHRPDIIHTHLRDADFLGQIVAYILRIKKRIYTRHSSNFNHIYFPHAVKWDKLINFLATDIVSISASTQYVLEELENVMPEKIHKIPHGFDLEMFNNRNEETIHRLKSKYDLMDKIPTIGVISRYIEWKGIEYVIRAFKKLLETYPNAKLILANARGTYYNYIQNELRNIPTQNYIEIPFENDIASLYHLFDIYVHVPIDKHIEAFGQTYIESMAAGIPGIFTLSGIGNQLCKHEQNCLVVEYKNSDQILNAMHRILEDYILRNSIIQNALKSSEDYGLEPFITNLEKIYNL